MPVILLHTHYDIIAPAVRLVSFLDRQADSLALIVAMADNPPLLIYHVPAVLCLVAIHVVSVI